MNSPPSFVLATNCLLDGLWIPQKMDAFNLPIQKPQIGKWQIEGIYFEVANARLGLDLFIIFEMNKKVAPLLFHSIGLVP